MKDIGWRSSVVLCDCQMLYAGLTKIIIQILILYNNFRKLYPYRSNIDGWRIVTF